MYSPTTSITQKFYRLTALSLAITLTGCGGGDTVDSIKPVPYSSNPALVPVTSGGTNTVDLNISEIYLLSNYTSIKMKKGSSVTVTALVLDDYNGIVEDAPVIFKITDPVATGVFSVSSSNITTDENGKAEITLEVLSALTKQQEDYLLKTGVTVEASIGNVTETMVLKGTTDNVDIGTEDVYDIYASIRDTELLTGEDKSMITVRVTDKNGGVVVGVPVTLGIQDAAKYGLSLGSASEQVTDSSGMVQVELIQSRVNLNSQIDHTSQLTIIVDDKQNSVVEETMGIIVNGTDVSGLTSSKTALTNNDDFTISGRIIDGKTEPLKNVTVYVMNEGKEVANTRTDALGKFDFNLNSSGLSLFQSNSYVLSLKIVGDDVEQIFEDVLDLASVTQTNISFSLAADDIVVRTRQPVTVNVPDANNGDTVTVSTNKGKIFQDLITPYDDPFAGSRKVLTVNNKKVEYYVESAAPGTAKLKAEFNNEFKDEQIYFVSILPTKLILQVEKSVLSKEGSTAVTALVLDEDDVPVKNAIVQFTTSKDASGGDLSSGVAVTDENGNATVFYTAGNNFTSSDGVIIESKVQYIKLPDGSEQAINTPIEDSTSLSVQSSSTYISFAFADKISSGTRQIYYYKQGSINVLNSTGKPAINSPVSINLMPYSYFKGEWQVVSQQIGLSVEKVWLRDPLYQCANEDKNKNGILDPGEDFNNNGQLDPINVAAILTADGQEVNSNSNFNFITDNKGNVNFQIRYPKEYSSWYQAEIVVNTNVEGSESQQARIIGFPTLVDDIDIEIPLRPNWVSPFGINRCFEEN